MSHEEKALQYLQAQRVAQDNKFRSRIYKDVVANLTDMNYCSLDEQFYLTKDKDEPLDPETLYIARYSYGADLQYNFISIEKVYNQVYTPIIKNNNLYSIGLLYDTWSDPEVIKEFLPHFEKFMQAYLQSTKYLTIA